MIKKTMIVIGAMMWTLGVHAATAKLYNDTTGYILVVDDKTMVKAGGSTTVTQGASIKIDAYKMSATATESRTAPKTRMTIEEVVPDVKGEASGIRLTASGQDSWEEFSSHIETDFRNKSDKLVHIDSQKDQTWSSLVDILPGGHYTTDGHKTDKKFKVTLYYSKLSTTVSIPNAVTSRSVKVDGSKITMSSR